jgi:hypothetical protein
MPSIAGDIELMPVTDIVAWLANRRPTATLTVRRRDVETRFLIRNGYCTQAWSTDPREYLGQHLINFGYIDEDGLQRAFDTQKETKVPLGRVLVMVEALTQEQLQRVLTFKTREGLLETLCWNDGSWKVTPGVDGDTGLDCEQPIDLREACSEAAARRLMWSEIRRVFPSDATRCDVLEPTSQVSSVFDRRLLSLMGTGKTIGEAALELRAMDFQTYARLYDLANRKLLRARVTTTEISAEDLAQLDILQGFAVASAPTDTSLVADRRQATASTPTTAEGASPSRSLTSPMRVTEGGAGPRPVPLPDAGTLSAGASSLPAMPSLADLARPTPLTTSPTQKASATATPSTTTPPAAGWSSTRVAMSATAPSPPGGAASSARPAGASPGGGMRVRPEQVVEGPGITVPAEAADPQNALRIALAGRQWSDVVTFAQRILEREPLHTEAIDALRVADGQLRRGRDTTEDLDLTRAPRLAMPRELIAQAHLSSKERYVLSRVDGARTLAQISAVSPISRTELVRIVDGFVARGVLSY